MAKRTQSSGVSVPIWQRVRDMRRDGVEQTIPTTERVIRLRTVEPHQLLKEGDIPDILTPLVVKAIYQDMSDGELVAFLNATPERAQDALAYMESLDLIARKSIADDTNLDDLSPGEKRWIFRLALAPAEVLATFRYEPTGDVEPVVEGETVPQATE